MFAWRRQAEPEPPRPPRRARDARVLGRDDHYSSEYEKVLKLILFGDSAVGKSAVFRALSAEQEAPLAVYETTIGVDFGTHMAAVHDCSCPGPFEACEAGPEAACVDHVKLQVWDTAGQVRFRTNVLHLCRSASAVLLVFDVTRRATFDALGQWICDLRQRVGVNVPILVVGNKADRAEQREVSEEDGRAFADLHGIGYAETSAVDRASVLRALGRALLEALDVARTCGWGSSSG